MAKDATRIDPVTALIEALEAKSAETPAEGPDRLAKAGEMIPDRQPTQTVDLSESEVMRQFRRAYIDGMIEASLIDEIFGIVKAVLIAKGIL